MMCIEIVSRSSRSLVWDGSASNKSMMCDGATAGASRDIDKKRTRAAGSEQTGWSNEARSETNDATATAVEQTPLLRIPAGTPAHVTNKRHKSTTSATDTAHS